MGGEALVNDKNARGLLCSMYQCRVLGNTCTRRSVDGCVNAYIYHGSKEVRREESKMSERQISARHALRTIVAATVRAM